MMEAYYNFKTTPFEKNISPENMYVSADLAELRERLEHMKQKRGIMLITGESGTGKTQMIRSFAAKLNPNHYQHFYIPLSTVNTYDFYRQMARSMTGEVCWKKSDLFLSIQKIIRDYVKDAKKIPVIIFDECHLLKNETWHELQILTNFEMDSQDPAIIILIGQPHLNERLLRPIHRSFNQRIRLKYHLNPLNRQQTQEYIIHQLKLCGGDPEIFNANALGAIYQNSGGCPRIINKIASLALSIGVLEKKEVLTEEEVYRASKEL